MFESIFRSHASVMHVGESNKGNPAFKDWCKRLSCGEKYPRGKFFRKQERMRGFLNVVSTHVACTTINAQHY